MVDVKISAGADPGSVVATDKVPMARSASTTAYAATMAELATYANGAYTPNYFTGTPSMDGTGAAGTAAFVSRGDHVHPSDTSRLALAGGTMVGFLTLNANPTASLHAATKQYMDGSAPVGGPYVAIANLHDTGRNYIHNPLFTVAQRGAGPFSNAYTVDRWQQQLSLDTSTTNQIAATDAMRTQTGDEAMQYVLSNSVVGNAGTTALTILTHKIERVVRLGAKTVTVSFYATANAALKLGVSIDQYFGSGGSPSTQVNGTGQSVTLAVGWTRYSLTFSVPSIIGKTLGTNGDDYTQLFFWLSAGSSYAARSGSMVVQSGTIQLWGVQLEIGSVATPLEKPDPRYDLANAQRFYCTRGIDVGGYNVAGSSCVFPVSFPTTMRAVPTIVFGTPAFISNTAGMSSYDPSTSGTNLGITITATGSSAWNGTFTASADL